MRMVGSTEVQERVPVLVLGIGNLLLRDDGVGVHVARALATSPPPDTLVLDVGTDFLGLDGFLERSDRVIAVDAVAAGGPPGSLYRLALDDVERTRQTSLHELGLKDALGFLPEEKRPPVVVLGIEPADISPGMELSARVAAALPRAVEEIARLALGRKSSRTLPR